MSSSDSTPPFSAATTRIGSFRSAWLVSSPTTERKLAARVSRSFFALGLAGLVAGCFQPLYAEHPLPIGAAASPGVVGQMR
ncbi:MAG: hypothetical protein WB005_06705, partial [Pseudolabrys sp.]